MFVWSYCSELDGTLASLPSAARFITAILVFAYAGRSLCVNVGNWQRTVPAWEKKFCSTVGSVPWHKIVEAKKFMYLYQNIVDWDDSAGEEAFWNAKNRFWAEINRLPCNVSLPDPDKYLDKVDWDSAADVDLLLDLDHETESIPGKDGCGSGKIIFGNALLDQSFSCTGWGDCDYSFARDPKVAQWDNDGWCKNSWEDNHNTASHYQGWGGGWDYPNPKVGDYYSNSWCKNSWEDNHNTASHDQGWGGGWDDPNPKFGDYYSNSWCKDPWQYDLSGKNGGWDTEVNNYWGWNETGYSKFNEFGNDYWNASEKRSSGAFGQGYNWSSSSNNRNQKHGRGLKSHGTIANALRT